VCTRREGDGPTNAMTLLVQQMATTTAPLSEKVFDRWCMVLIEDIEWYLLLLTLGDGEEVVYGWMEDGGGRPAASRRSSCHATLESSRRS
jgi:hypothetical protein